MTCMHTHARGQGSTSSEVRTISVYIFAANLRRCAHVYISVGDRMNTLFPLLSPPSPLFFHFCRSYKNLHRQYVFFMPKRGGHVPPAPPPPPPLPPPMCSPNAPWYSEDLQRAKQELRRLERKKRSSKLEIDQQIFKTQCRAYNSLINQAKEEFHMNQFKHCALRELFQKVIASASHRLQAYFKSRMIQMSSWLNVSQFFFAEKIEKIASEFNSSNLMFDDCSNVTPSFCHSVFEKFSAVSVLYSKS